MGFSQSFQILVNVTSNIFNVKRENVKVCPWPRTVITVYLGHYKIEVCEALLSCFSWRSQQDAPLGGGGTIDGGRVSL